jgi:adenylate kinase family enzyme
MIPIKIHILGASGSGTTTLGKAIASKYNVSHFDSDDFFWMPTDPPFRQKRPVDQRISLLKETLLSYDSWVVSGSALKWGDFLREDADLIIQTYLEPDIRINRLLKREFERYGERIKPGGDMHNTHCEFVAWAKLYDNGGPDKRSRLSEEMWLKKAKCLVIRIDSGTDIDTELTLVENAIKELKI